MTKNSNNISNQQNNYMTFYEHALKCFDNDNIDEGRRSVICAVDALMRIAAELDPDVGATYIDKARRLLEGCSKLSPRYGNDYMKYINDDVMGVKVNAIPSNSTTLQTNHMDYVAGLEDVKLEINRKIIYPMKYPRKFQRYKKALGGGILLYGLPGTGKTMIARAIADECKALFLPIRCSDILSKWVGNSEGNLKKLFEKAKTYKRVVIFMDEFESIGAKRSGDIDNVMNRVVTELLQQMQGLELKESGSNIVILAATNRPWDIDSAFLRSGRFGSKIYVPLPNAAAREQIIRQSLNDIPVEGEIVLDNIVKDTEGYNGADVFELCEVAKMYAIEREIESGSSSAITVQDLEKASKEVHSSVVNDDYDTMKDYLSKMGIAV